MTYVYVGGYTEPDRGGRGPGISVYRQNETTSELTELQTVGGVANPHFLALHPNKRFVYSTNGGDASGVSAFQVDGSNGHLTLLNQQPSPGAGPTHLGLDPTGKLVVVANYAGGSVAAFPIADDGRVQPHSDFHQHAGKTGPNPKRQDKPHAHMAGFDPTGKFVLICDLGMDRTFVYRVDVPSGKLTLVEPLSGEAPAGAGPRHLAFHPNGKYVFVINELAGAVTSFAWDGAGKLTPIETVSSLPSDFSGENISAEVVVHPNGRFVYASNRGHDSLAIFRCDAATGRLTPSGHVPTGGGHPRHFDLDPRARFLYCANQDSDNVVHFAVDQSTGALTPTAQVTKVGTPSCVLFRPD
jgi:6-phosphogluconolactonase